MGFFSWKTSDTKRSIANIENGVRRTFPVNMKDNQNNRWLETAYRGFGVFGGKDYYELLAQMNGKKTREEGIELAFSRKKVIRPKLTEDPSKTWQELPDSEICEFQGHFYPDSDQHEAFKALKASVNDLIVKKPRKGGKRGTSGLSGA
jgi:hypothetical protein